MDEFREYFGHHGCLWKLGHIIAFIFAVIGIFSDANTVLAWIILIGETIEIVLYIFMFRRQKGIKKNYNREDSYWSKKNTHEEHLKDESESDDGSIS